MSKKKRKKMTEQTITANPDTREVIGLNPDGTPIYRDETVQEAQHTGETVNPDNVM